MKRYSKKARKHSRKTKIMKGGAGANFRNSRSYANVVKGVNTPYNDETQYYSESDFNNQNQTPFDYMKNNYYLCTTSRYNKPITDFLRPFGNLDELESIISNLIKTHELLEYHAYSFLDHIKSIKTESDKIADVKIVGTSQFGLYFRFVKKSVINTKKFYKSNSNQFKQTRTFVFDIEKLLNYVKKYAEYNHLPQLYKLPLCWFANSNAYGYQQYSNATFMYDIDSFLTNVKHRMTTITHEFVCRIPIPLNEEAGFLGKVYTSTISL